MLTIQIGPSHVAEDARSVREDSAELASYLLSDKRNIPQPPAFLSRRRSHPPLPSPQLRTEIPAHESHDHVPGAGPEYPHSVSDIIPEVSEPSSPTEERHWPEGVDGEGVPEEGPSLLTNLLRQSPPQSARGTSPERHVPGEEPAVRKRTRFHERTEEQPRSDTVGEEATEHTPLLKTRSSSETRRANGRDTTVDVESQKRAEPRRRWLGRIVEAGRRAQTRCAHAARAATDPDVWTPKALWRTLVVTPASCLPAVLVGLLLNVLDALSYGESHDDESNPNPGWMES